MSLRSPLNIPFVQNPGNACALSCLTMVASYFFPDRYSFEDIGRVAKYQKGYVVWEFPFFRWFLEKGGHISFWDDIDYHTWIESGFEGLANILPQKEFSYFQKVTFDPNALTLDIRETIQHKNFSFLKHKPCLNDLKKQMHKGALCSVVLNGNALIKRDGLELHQVLVLDITNTEIIFHNPFSGPFAQAAQKESIDFFCKAWLTATECPAMTAFSLEAP